MYLIFTKRDDKVNTPMNTDLSIQNLHVEINETEILHGIDLTIPAGEIHMIMGPNGSGKSTLSQVIFGHPLYRVTKGDILYKGESLLKLTPEKRAHLGLFLAFQSPHAIPGVNIRTFLKQAVNAKNRAHDPEDRGMKIREYRELLEKAMNSLQMNPHFADRYVNEGFSGGEKKKSEILQLALLKPDMALLDEIDSGLDVDALRVVCEQIQRLQKEHGMGVVCITHYPRMLQYIKSDAVHVLMDGKLVASGTKDLAERIEKEGYDWLR